MFERFTERARQLVVLAQDEARGFQHNYIGTEHLLLGGVSLPEGQRRAALPGAVGWLMYAVVLGIGILVGWAIRGH